MACRSRVKAEQGAGFSGIEIFNTMSVVVAAALFLSGCQPKPPACDDEKVLTAVRRLMTQQLIEARVPSLPVNRRTGVLQLGTEWLAGANFAIPGSHRYDSKAKRHECRAEVSMPVPGSISDLRASSSFRAGQKEGASSAPETFRTSVRYAVEFDGNSQESFLVKAGDGGIVAAGDAQSLLLHALDMDAMVKVSSANEIFRGKWRGTFSCGTDVFIPYPEHKPPQAWTHRYSEAIEFDVVSVFDLPQIKLSELAPPQPAILSLAPAQPVLTASIPYHVNLERVVDAAVSETAIHFSSADHGPAVVHLQGEVKGDHLEASGFASRGDGMLYSKKPCAIKMNRSKLPHKEK